MAQKEQRLRILAADTNVPLDVALGRDAVIDALAVIRRRVPRGSLLIPPTVAAELAFTADKDPLSKKRAAATRFFEEHRAWGFKIIRYVPLGEEFVRQVADALRSSGLIEEEEVNDSLLLVESAALDCEVLLTSDEHLRGVEYDRLTFELRKFDLPTPVIRTPREIVRSFLN